MEINSYAVEIIEENMIVVIAQQLTEVITLFVPNNFTSDLEENKINKVEYRLPKITIGG